MAKFLQRDGVALRALEPEDVNILYMWEDEADAWQSRNSSAPYSRRLLRDYLNNYSADIYANGEVRSMITLHDEAVGTLDVFNFDPLNGRAEIGVYVDAGHRDSLVGSTAIALAVEGYAFDVLGLNQVYATVRVDNEGAIAAFAKAGFCKVAVIRQWLKKSRGEYSDAVIMQRLAR